MYTMHKTRAGGQREAGFTQPLRENLALLRTAKAKNRRTELLSGRGINLWAAIMVRATSVFQVWLSSDDVRRLKSVAVLSESPDYSDYGTALKERKEHLYDTYWKPERRGWNSSICIWSERRGRGRYLSSTSHLLLARIPQFVRCSGMRSKFERIMTSSGLYVLNLAWSDIGRCRPLYFTTADSESKPSLTHALFRFWRTYYALATFLGWESEHYELIFCSIAAFRL